MTMKDLKISGHMTAEYFHIECAALMSGTL